MREISDLFLAMFIVVLAMIAAVFVGVLGYSLGISAPACRDYGKISGNEVHYSLANGCLVKAEDQWVDIRVLTSKKQELTIRRK